MGDVKCSECAGIGVIFDPLGVHPGPPPKCLSCGGAGNVGLRCAKTSNPCGTDTWAAGYTCPCASCRLYVLTEAARWAVEHLNCNRVLGTPCADSPIDGACSCSNCTAWRKLAAAVGEKTP
jgi:hypothetical protein